MDISEVERQKRIKHAIHFLASSAGGTGIPVENILALTPAAHAANAGYVEAVDGALDPVLVEGETIARLQSFGANWCMVDLQPLGNENLWAGAPTITVSFPELTGAPSGILSAASGYSYGGTVTNIQALLNAEIGNSVQVIIGI